MSDYPSAIIGLTTRRHLAMFDEYAAHLTSQARAEGHSIPCRKGCGACCYDVTEVAHFEIAPLIEHLRELPAEVLDVIERRLHAWREGMLAAGLDPTLPGPDLRTYHRAHLACPLLDLVTHECGVYAVRPLACRGHYLIDQPAEVCSNRADVPTVQTLTMDEGLGVVLRSLLKDYAGITGSRTEVDVGSSTLQGMLLDAWPLVRDPGLSIVEWMVAQERADVRKP